MNVGRVILMLIDLGECVVMTRIIVMNLKKVREGLVVSNGCTLSHLAVLESGATPTRRKGRMGRVCVRCCSNYLHLGSVVP